MTIYTNPKMGVAPTANTAGVPSVFPFEFDFTNTTYRPATVAALDLIQIAIVPAGHTLLPQLCRFAIPAIDAGGAPTGDYSLGTLAVPAALHASAASETPQALFGEDILVPTAAIGSPTDDTPIYIKAINASQTAPTTGKIVSELAYRAWDSALDA